MTQIPEEARKEYFKALSEKSTHFEGVFYVGVKSKGIFCLPSCSIDKPSYEDCEFFRTPKEALLASYQPCQQCHPILQEKDVSDLVRHIVQAVEVQPEKRWKEADFRTLSLDLPKATRQFKRKFGMTFVEYARARRLGLAMKQIRGDETMFESPYNLQDAFSQIMGALPLKQQKNLPLLKSVWLETPLGPMLAVGDEKALWLLEFVDRRGLEREIERIRTRMKCAIVPGQTPPLQSIERELKEYFAGTLKEFKTPLHLIGSPFQKKVWEALMTIPYGETRSYAEQAAAIGQPTAFRAVANANGANQISIVIPCHRIINSNGELGGYGGGIARKKWLLDHEKAHLERA